jgi:hypothetical protein
MQTKTRSSRRRLGWALATAAGVAVGLVGCGSLSDNLKLCGQIPADGCPIGRGGTCEDAACAALYDCVDGAWTEVTTCGPVGSGGSGGSGGSDADAGTDASCGVVIDDSGEMEGCAPDLQTPDCPAAAAESCAACQSDCVDFYLCTSEGWLAVAYCDEQGQVIVTP